MASRVVEALFLVSFGCLVQNFGCAEVGSENNGNGVDCIGGNTGNIPPKPNSSLTLTAKPDPFLAADPTTQAKLTLRRDLFSNENGNVLFYALLVALENYSEPPQNGSWDITRGWPDLPNWLSNNTPFQVTPAKWNPFRLQTLNTEITYTLGDGSCDCDRRYCNVALKENTKYTLKIRGFTDSGYQDTDEIYFKTLDKLPVPRIVSVLGGLVLVTAAAVCLSIYNLGWIKRMRLSPGKKTRFSPIPEALSHRSFLKYSEELLNTPGRLGNEFHLLGTLSSDVSTFCLHAQKVDNRGKNRYGNVLPFDMTRVKLSVINDDPTTDYINASFIRGFKQEVQYIASQGPKEETCHDFYRMIIEQNIELVVMLTDLYENDVEKCFKYYPDENEVLRFRDITITCKEEEELGVYTKRVFAIFSSGRSFVVTHLHFKNWRDFQCPESPESVVKFCDLIAKKYRKGCMLVHCSAGAGRTGTFIAIDILLQDVKTNSRINVFDTVLKLRQQRVNMVSTEAQLGFIYKCVTVGIKRALTKAKETV